VGIRGDSQDLCKFSLDFMPASGVRVVEFGPNSLTSSNFKINYFFQHTE